LRASDCCTNEVHQQFISLSLFGIATRSSGLELGTKHEALRSAVLTSSTTTLACCLSFTTLKFSVALKLGPLSPPCA
jgi:hypothetical protein